MPEWEKILRICITDIPFFLWYCAWLSANIGRMRKKNPKVGANNRPRINSMVTREEREGREEKGGLASLKS